MDSNFIAAIALSFRALLAFTIVIFLRHLAILFPQLASIFWGIIAIIILVALVYWVNDFNLSTGFSGAVVLGGAIIGVISTL